MKLFDYKKMLVYLLNYSIDNDLENTTKALLDAYILHYHQKRKDGDPYIIHPLTIACDAISLGFKDDNLLATILLHDVEEDCNIKVSSLGYNESICTSVGLVTYKKGVDTLEDYYTRILKDRNASITKILDRKHNISTMINVFSDKKVDEYTEETIEYVLPLLRKIKYEYPELGDFYHTMKGFFFPMIDALNFKKKLLTK